MTYDRSARAPAAVAPGSSRRPVSGPVPKEVLVGSSGLAYTPLRKLGEGGMAEILLAYAEGTGGFSKLVVLKMMRRYLDGASDFRSMFLEEARVSARLNHPNLVQVYEVVDEGETPFIAMEYLEGKPLSRLRGLAALPREMLLTVVCEALVGLHHAHEAVDFDGSPLGIVHRDVSPHNVFVTYDGVVKILDFGIAKTIAASSQTKTGEIKGKLSYMPPEQLLGEELDRRADVFAMGAALWELLLDKPLWGGLEQGTVMHRLATGQIPRPTPQHALDPELEAIIVRATAPEREDRFQTALELQRALSAYRERLPRVYTPREVGEALASVFHEDRAAEREAVRLALKAPSLPPAAASIMPDPVPLAPSGSRRTALPWVLALCAIGAAAVLGTRFAGSGSAPVPQDAAAPAASARLVFRVKPEQAQIEVDGKLRGSGSFELSVPSDALLHRVVVSAPGHTTTSRSVRFTGTQYLEFQLTPEPAPAAPERAAPASDSADAPREDEKKSSRRVTGSRIAAPAAASAAPLPGPEAGEGSHSRAAGACDPPFYFKDGVKTYRDECL